jgi:hypothetical protein
MIYTVEMDSDGMIYAQSFMKISTDFQALLRFCLRNLRDCNVGITNGECINYAFEIGSNIMILIGSGIERLMGGALYT